jgi:hypothetical protein
MSKRLISCIGALALMAYFQATAAGQDPAAGNPDQTRYLDELYRKAAEKHLDSERYWKILLHYEWIPLRGFVSRADGPGFFLSPGGKTDPRAELNATLEKFFSDELVGTSKQQAQCAFPARYRWLKERLEFDPARLPERNCARFKHWVSNLDPESVTLVFPSAYMNSPSSMFGHTLLRIDQKGQTEQTRILSYVINYAADVDRNASFFYQLLGVAGGIEGSFSIMPYYLKVQEYSEMESRDIWEYRLSFDREQIERMLMHAWELGNTYFDYFFFKENCSYHLLSLLEAADPELDLTDRFYFWTIPSDTVRLIRTQPGLVKEITFRPSRTTEIIRRREMLSGSEYALLRRIVREPAAIKSEDFSERPVNRQAFILDTAYDYVRYRGLAAYKEKDPLSGTEKQLLESRSRLPVRSETVKIEPITDAPETGHKSVRVGAGAGWDGKDSFEEISFRPGYHDLLDRQKGYNPGSQIEGLHARFRYYNETEKFRLHRLDLVHILSLTPIDALFRKPSWNVSAGWDTVPVGNGSPGHRVFRLSGGVGGAFQSKLWRSELYYALAEADAEYGRSFIPRFRAGAGGTGGIIVDLLSRWRLSLRMRYISYPAGARSFDFERSVEQRLVLSTNLAVRAGLDRRNRQTQSVFRLDFYF